MDQAEVLEFTKSYLAGQYMRYGIPTPPPEEITQSAMRILGNKEESKRIYQDLYGRKVMNVIKAAIKLDEKEVSLDEFKKIANPNGEHEHHHDHDHDHDH